MDDKVLRLIDRAINENLSYSDVTSIMSFNGYDDAAIDQAIQEIKKKRPEFVTDYQSPSEQTDSLEFGVPSPPEGEQGGSDSGSQSPAVSSQEPFDPIKEFQDQYKEDRLGLQDLADQKIQTAQDLNDVLRAADPDPINFFESTWYKVKNMATAPSMPGQIGPNIMMGLGFAKTEEDIQRAKQQEEFDNDIDAQIALRENRLLANDAINQHLGFKFDYFKENQDGILVRDPNKHEKFKAYVDGMNNEGQWLRSQIAIEDAIKAETINKELGFGGGFNLMTSDPEEYIPSLDMTVGEIIELKAQNPGLNIGDNTLGQALFNGLSEGLGDKIYGVVGSVGMFTRSLDNNLKATLMDVAGHDENIAGRLLQEDAARRSQIHQMAGLDPRDDRTFTEYYEDGEIGKGNMSLGLTLAEQVPQIAITIVAPPAGLAVGAVSAGVSSYTGVRNRLDLSPGEKFATTLVSAGAEYLFEKIAFGDIKAARKAFGIDDGIAAATKAEKKAVQKEVLDELRKQTRFKPLKNVAKQALEEGGEEFGVELTNAVTAWLISGEEADPRAFLESFIVGSIMGGGMSAGPAILSKGLNSMASMRQMKEFRAVTDEIQALKAKLEQPMSPYDRQKIEERITELGLKQREITAISMDLYAAMPKEVQAEMFKIHKDFDAAYQAYTNSTSKQAKDSYMNTMKSLLKDKALLEQEYGADARLAILSDPKKAGIKEEYNEKYEDSNEFEGKIKGSRGLSEESARVLNNIFGAVRGKKKVRVHNNVRSLLNANKDARALAMQGGSSPGYYDKNTGTIHVLSPEAFRAYNQHRENIGRPTQDIAKVYHHEVIHPIIEEMMEADPEMESRLYSEIEALRGKNSIADEAFAFGEKYASRGEATQQNEVVTEFLALMSRKINIDRMSRENSGLLQRIKDMFNDMLTRAGVSVKINTNDELMTVANNLAQSLRMGGKVSIREEVAPRRTESTTDTGYTAPTTGTEPSVADPDSDAALDSDIEETLFTLITPEYNPNAKDTDRLKELSELTNDSSKSYDVLEAALEGPMSERTVSSIAFGARISLSTLRGNVFPTLTGSLTSSPSEQDIINSKKSEELIAANEDRLAMIAEFEESAHALQRKYNEAKTEEEEKKVVLDYLAKLASGFDYHKKQIQYQLSLIGAALTEDQRARIADDVKIAESYQRDINDPSRLDMAYSAADGVFQLGKQIMVDENLLQNSDAGAVMSLIGLKKSYEIFNAAYTHNSYRAALFNEKNELVVESNVSDLVSEIRSLIQAFQEDDRFKKFINRSNEYREYTAIEFISDYIRDYNPGKYLSFQYALEQPEGYAQRVAEPIEIAGTKLDRKNYPILSAILSANRIDNVMPEYVWHKEYLPKDSKPFSGYRFQELVEMDGLDTLFTAIIATELNKMGAIPQGVRFWNATQEELDLAKKASKLLPLQPKSDILTEKLFLDSPLMKSLDQSVLKMKAATVDQWMKYFSEVKGGSIEAEAVGMRDFLEQYMDENPNTKSVPFEAIQHFLKQNAFTVSANAPKGIYRWAEAFYDADRGFVVLPATVGGRVVGPKDIKTAQPAYPDFSTFDPTHNYPATSVYEIVDVFEGQVEAIVEIEHTNGESYFATTYLIEAEDLEQYVDNSEAYQEYMDSNGETDFDIETAVLAYINNGTTSEQRWDMLSEHQENMAEEDEDQDDDSQYIEIDVGKGLSSSEAITTAMNMDRMYSLGSHTSYSIAYGGAGNPRAGKNYSEILIQHPSDYISETERYVQPAHYSEPNVIAFTRIAEGTAADGGRVLIMDELQSDWGQDARKHGMAENPKTRKVDENVIKGQNVIDLLNNHAVLSRDYARFSNSPLSTVISRVMDIAFISPRVQLPGGGTSTEQIHGILNDSFDKVRVYFESAPHHLVYFGQGRFYPDRLRIPSDISQSDLNGKFRDLAKTIFELAGVDYDSMVTDMLNTVVSDPDELAGIMSVLSGEEKGNIEELKSVFEEIFVFPIVKYTLGDFTGQKYGEGKAQTPYANNFTRSVDLLLAMEDWTPELETLVHQISRVGNFDYNDANDVADIFRKAMAAESVDELNKILAEIDTDNIFMKIGQVRMGDHYYSVKHDIIENSWGTIEDGEYGIEESKIDSKRQKFKEFFEYDFINSNSMLPVGDSNPQQMRLKNWHNTAIDYEKIFEQPEPSREYAFQGIARRITRKGIREERLKTVKDFWTIRAEVSKDLLAAAPKLMSRANETQGFNAIGSGSMVMALATYQARDFDLMIENVTQRVNELHDDLDALNLDQDQLLLAFDTISSNHSRIPYTPYGNRTEDWAGLGIRVATQLATQGGFDYLVWLPGYFQTKRWGDSGTGPAKFYDNVLPKIAQKSVKRFDNKAKIKPINVLNIHNDVSGGAFQALGFKISDKMKNFFEENNATMFTLDTDFAADVPAETKENPITILNALTFADQSSIETNVQFKEQLTKMLHEDPNRDQIINKYGLILEKAPDGLMHYRMDDNLAEYLADAFELETLVAIKAYPDAIGWYDETVTKAMTVVELMYPEIKNDPNKAAVMKMAIAITSNGLKVKQNFALAVKQYEYFRANGKFNPDLAEGTQGGAMTSSFTFINKVLDVMSIENFVNFLTTPVRNGDMFYYKVGKDGKKSKQNLTGNYPADYELFGASVFGPKIGNGFFMNLMGEFQTLTIDRWLTRQFGRLRGDLLIGRNLENTKKADKRFKRAVKDLGKRDRKKLAFLNNELSDPNAKMTGRDGDINWNQIASDISSAATKGANLEILQSDPKLQELRKAANGLTKYLAGEKESPASGRERVFMENVFKELQNRLFSKYGISITIADLQAVNWYPEKALYQTFQANSSISSAKDFTSEEEKPDYFSGASEVAREKGITQKQIDNAIEQLDFRHDSVRDAVRKGNGQFGTANQEADLEGIRQAINQVRAGQEVTQTFFHLDEEFTGFTQGSRLGDVKYSSMQPHVKQAKTYLERKMNVQPYMELEGPDVIKSPADIAFLLRHMESDSSESTFLVVRDINNPENYDVTYMTTGTVNSAMVDYIKVRQIVTNFQEIYGPETEIEVTLVHNHPSGNLRSSDGDRGMHGTMLDLFATEDKVQVGDSVIINLDSGQYATFTSQEFKDVTHVSKKPTKTKNVKVQNFNRQELFRPRTADKLIIRGPSIIPQFLSHFKVSPTTKLGYLVMNQQNAITRVAVLDSASSAKSIGLMMERTVGKYGNAVIFFGNDRAALKAAAQASKSGLDTQKVKILDVLYIEPDPSHRYGFATDSANNRGMVPGGRMTNFTLEEVSEAAPEGAMSIEESLQVTELQAKKSPLYRERDLDLPNFKEIQSVIKGHKAGRKILDENAPLQHGDLVGGRLNLNLVEAGQNKYGYRMSILSVHKPKSQDSKKYQEHNGVSTLAREKVVRNLDVMTIRNAYFNVNVKGSSEVGAMLFNKFVNKMNPAEIKEKYPTAKNKFPLASVDGEFVDIPRENSNFDGIMIKYNPMTSHMFMDVTGRPIKFAEEVTLMGDRAYARGKIIYADTAWDLHSVPGIGVGDFIVPTKVTTNPDKITATHNMMMESGIQFTIDDSGHESHNIIDEAVVNMRRTASRFAASLTEGDADIRKKIYDNPENYINEQKIGDIKNRLEEMSDADLVEAMSDNALVNLSMNPDSSNDNIFVLAAIERINRMQANNEDTSDAIEALAKVGTTVGRMLRHFAELKTSTPIGIVQMIENAMGKSGRIMTDAQRQNLMKIADKYIAAQRALIDHQENIDKMDSAEFTKEFTRLSKELDAITRTMNKFTGVLIPKSYGSLIGTFIKGNLMTPVSLVTNVVANIFEQGRFLIQRPIESGIHFLSFKASRLVSKLLGKDVGVQEYYGREMGVTLLALPYALKQGALGFAKSIKGMFVKSGETNKIVYTGINPMFALYAMISDTALGNYLNKTFGMSMLNTDLLPRTKDGKIKAGDRVKLMIEGIFGIAPDIVFRALSVGDLPFSRFSGSFVVYNEAIKKFGYKARNTDEFKNFLKYPPQEVLLKMEREGERATFQEKNKAADALLQFRKLLEGKGRIPGRVMGFLFDSFMPYIKTPANIFVSTMKIAMPGLGAMSAMYNYSVGNHKKANEDLAMAVFGTMIIKAADLLIAAGAIIGAFTDEDKEEKALQYAYTGGPMRVNTTAISRYLTSFDEKDLEYQEGDSWRKIDKAGIIGVVMGARATATKGVEIDKTSKNNTYYFPGEDPLFDSQFIFKYMNPSMVSGTFKFINSMSFLQGGNTLLSMLAGDAEGYEMQRNIDNWFRSVSSIALPNTISALNRADREFMPLFRNKDVGRRMKYILLDKTFNVDGYPARVDLVGRDILQTPEGKNPYYYHMFSVLKGQEVDPHPVIQEYYRLMVATGDGSWLPSAPSKATSYYYTPSKTDLGPKLYSEIQGLIGPGEKVKIRFNEEELLKVQKQFYTDLTDRIERLMETDLYKQADDDRKIELIENNIDFVKKSRVTTGKDPVFGTTKRKNQWYQIFQEMTLEGAKRLSEQLKETE